MSRQIGIDTTCLRPTPQRKMWQPLKKAGKKVLFCSDGRWAMFMEDIARCGADCFILEPSNDLDYVAVRFGRIRCIVPASRAPGSDRVWDETSAAAFLEIVQGIHLAGRFQFPAVDGIMPALDVN